MATVTADNPKELVKDNLINALNEVKLAQEGKIKLDDARDLFIQIVLSIYDKGEIDNVSDAYIKQIVKNMKWV